MDALRKSDWFRKGVDYTVDTVEVVRLKLRIIGFSNKLTGLYARLGEKAFSAHEAGGAFADEEAAQRLMADIREARREIKEAEEGIEKIRSPKAEEPQRPKPVEPEEGGE